MEKITFKIAYLYPSSDPKLISLHTESKSGKHEFIDNVGIRRTGPPEGNVKAATYTLGAIEAFNYQGQPQKRVTTTISYVPSEFEGKLEVDEKMSNMLAREAHNLLRSHQNVVVRDVNGNNINPNAYGTPLFELIEESKIIRDKNEKDDKITEALLLVKNLYEDNQETFIDLCYSYGIRPIENIPVEVLLGEVRLKITHNPDKFMEVLTHKELKLTAMINRGLQQVDGQETIIKIDNNFYYMDEEIIGAFKEDGDLREVLDFFNRYPRKKEILMRRLGITPEVNIKVTNLPKTSDEISYTKGQSIYQEQADAKRTTLMKMAVKNMFKNQYEKKKKNPEKNIEITEDFEAKLLAKSSEYADVKQAFDDYVAKLREDKSLQA